MDMYVGFNLGKTAKHFHDAAVFFYRQVHRFADLTFLKVLSIK